MLEFETLVWGYFRPEQLIIRYDPALRMPITPDIQAWMDALWEQQQAERAREGRRLLVDSPLFRLVSASAHQRGRQHDTLHLTLGDTSYKEYVATRTPEFAGKHARHELSNALGICSVVETRDGYILLDKRKGVDVYAGRYHVIGGFFERGLDSNEQQRPDPFAAVSREIREETGIQPEDIESQHCLGVVYDLATPHGEICFLTRLRIPLAQVQTRTPEDDEVQQLHPLHVTPTSLRNFIVSNHGNISATGEPNLLFYGAVKFNEGWFEQTMQQL
jgi:8-oxo-dGTP pyrophosphatase MutT (NUDIX family)